MSLLIVAILYTICAMSRKKCIQCVRRVECKLYTQHGITTVYIIRHHTRRVKCRIIHTIFVLLRQTLGLLCIHYTASHNDSDAVLSCHFFDFVVYTIRHHAKGLLLYGIIQMFLLHIQYGITWRVWCRIAYTISFVAYTIRHHSTSLVVLYMYFLLVVHALWHHTIGLMNYNPRVATCYMYDRTNSTHCLTNFTQFWTNCTQF